MFDAGAITQDSAAAYTSEPELTEQAAARLRAAGFQVLQVAPQTINVAAPPGLYEAYFQTTLLAEERPVLKPGQRETTATFVECPSTDLPGLVDASRSPVAGLVEGVAIEKPVYAHELPLPPPVSYWHLDVPGDLTLALDADRAHRAGVTGREVRLAMVDSGWYRHSYFEARGYRATVALAPGAADPDSDEHGHGTGESANALALAPDVDFTMVKMSSVNSIGAFNTAVQLDPPPQVISCSWGSEAVNGPLAAADQALAAATALAVAGGIVVVFSAGNGHFSFPGQHPDVISAGGVFMEQDGGLRASDYASGFESKVYPGRGVPDVSGVVGMLPHAAYLMLPVQPGCHIDRELGGRGYPARDRTGSRDGWAAFSGTSAAAPQVAGVCALIRQVSPALPPAAVRDLLSRTARDVTRGSSHPRTGPHPAGQGYDLATGHGLVDAWSAVREARARRTAYA